MTVLWKAEPEEEGAWWASHSQRQEHVGCCVVCWVLGCGAGLQDHAGVN